jgi:hypothetical protein
MRNRNYYHAITSTFSHLRSSEISSMFSFLHIHLPILYIISFIGIYSIKRVHRYINLSILICRMTEQFLVLFEM